MDIAPDTNFLEGISPRRFLTSLQETRGHETVVLPTVQREMASQVALAGERQFRHHAANNPALTPEETDRIASSVAEAAMAWWTEESLRNDRPWLVPDPDRTLTAEYSRVQTRLPEDLFRDARTGRDSLNDRWIVTEAIVHKVPVFATSNMLSAGGIEMINECLEKKGYAEHTRVLTPDFAVRTVLDHDGAAHGEGSLRAILGAIIPADPESIAASTIARSLAVFTDKLRKGPLPKTAAAAETHAAAIGLNGLVTLARQIHGQRPMRTRNAAARYSDAIRQGAVGAGYDWKPAQPSTPSVQR